MCDKPFFINPFVKKLTKAAITVLLCFLVYSNAWSASVKITGKAPEYASQTIELYTSHDFISEEKTPLGVIKFASDGSFNATLDITDITFCQAEFDGYKGMIYLEPGKTYELAFPPKRSLTEAQKRNPFVKPDPVWFGLISADKTELNYRIQYFEQEYAKLENKYFDRIFVSQEKSLVDTIKISLDKLFPKTNSPFFEAHKLYRKANLDFALYQAKSAEFMETYFNKNRPWYTLNSYAVIFEQVFSNYFIRINNDEVIKLINAADLSKLDLYFQSSLHFKRALSHLILLRSMKDAYYSKQFAKSAILKMLEQVKTSDWNSYEKETAQLIASQLVYLSSGTLPPSITMMNLSGQKISLSDFKNSYIYLHFTDPKNSICRQHLDMLKTIASHYKDKLIIINVIPDGKGFKNESNWPGIFATTSANIERTYKVKTYPNAFLIGKDGKLLLSPAPNPIDGFDRIMGQLIKSDYYKNVQKQSAPAIK